MEENAPRQIKMREQMIHSREKNSEYKQACVSLADSFMSFSFLYFYHLMLLCLKLLNYERFWLQSWKLLKFFRVCDIKVRDQMAPKFSEKHIMQISSAIMSKPVTLLTCQCPHSLSLCLHIQMEEDFKD